MLIFKLNELVEGKIIKRPSAQIKSPYVADVSINENQYLAHTPALGCCGLSDVDSNVLLLKSTNKNKCGYVVYLSLINEGINSQIVGINPKLAEKLVENALKMNCFSKLNYVKKYFKEQKIYVENKIGSRFDIIGVDKDNNPFIMEIKNVPLADYEDVSSKDRKKMDFSGRDFNSKVAYFPDGYRKSKKETVSPRALKHITELTTIKKETQINIRCIMCYVIQRTDVNRFQPSIIDPHYREAFINAINSGVEIITMVVSWNRNGEAYFVRDDLPISI
jgi:DNA-binding sugar fermentation-stimulating protein